jgi:hypothetical protein
MFFAFVPALGEVDDLKYAAAGAMRWLSGIASTCLAALRL